MKGSTVPAGTRGSHGAAQVLYESPTTRVFRVAHRGAVVVCKELLGPDAAERSSHEWKMLSLFARVPGIVQLVPGTPSSAILMLEDRAGLALSERLREGPLSPGDLLTLALPLVRAVAAVHRAGVIHRDINPANIVLAADGNLLLIDFGLAVPSDGQLETTGVVGTLGYVAPEQTGRTGRAVDQRADLYALGATLFEMATGHPPFQGSDALQLIHDHLVREPAAPSRIDARIPRGLSDVILRLLAKAPEQRYQSAEGLWYDLARLRDEIGRGGDGVFQLGAYDFPARLAPPDLLVGREAERAVLATALADALGTPRRTLLIEGPAGVGKSALMQELRPMVAAAGGWFVYGKFDQYQREGATAGAVTHALRALGRLLLARPGDELAHERARIQAALGRGAALVTQMSPEFAVLLGPQPEPPEVDPQQAELRMQQVTVDLLSALASPQRPVVVVLDDLQWAGALSLRGFERLIGEPGLRGVLLVGAYRPEEIDAGHVLSPMLARWNALAQAPAHLALGNLSVAGMGRLIERMLRLAPGPASELSRAVHGLTGGNPFDTVEMINALRRDGVLHLGENGWQWDEAAIRRFVGKGHVVDLLAARIARLPAASRELLECMSCLGNTVECVLLAAAMGIEEADLRERLHAPLEDGLLLLEQGEGQDAVKFRHDRVQQAVLGAMDDEQRAGRQLAMARRLAPIAAFEDDAAQQYLACFQRLEDPLEQLRTATLFFALARRLASTATYQLAERYLAAAGSLVEARRDPRDAPLRSAIEKERHAALYSLGRLEESDPLYSRMQAGETEPLELVEPACLQMRSLFMRGRTNDARDLGLDLLAQLGLHVAPGYLAPDARERLDTLGEWVRRESGLDHASRPRIEDPRLLAIAKLLSRMARPAYFSADQRAYEWLMLESQRLWAQHGPCAELVASLGRMSGMLIASRQDFRTAFDIARHVLTVGEAQGYEPQASEARFIFCAFAAHWFEPLEEVSRHLARAFEGVQAGGDASYAGYVHAILITCLLEIAPTIDVSVAEVDAGIALCQRTSNLHAAAQHMCERQMLRALRGLTNGEGSFEDAQFAERAFLARAGQLPYVEHTYAECRALYSLVMGDVDALVANATLGMSLLGNLGGYYMALYANFFMAMARARQLQAIAELPDREQALNELERCRAWLAARAADQPYNFLHLARLVEAEQAWATGDEWRAAAAFDAAVGEAAKRQRPWHRALITERAGLFQISRGLGNGGRELLAKARDLYEAWGASAKVTRMLREHPFLRQSEELASRIPLGVSVRGSAGVSAEALDLMGVLRASQALSSETSLQQLTARVVEVLAALSGATQVLVLSYREDQWWLLAPGTGEAAMPVARAGEAGLLPLSAFAYAERTGQALVVDDAVTDDRFARDPYFAGVAFCSLLVAPIASQGTTRAMLLLENRQGRAAFNGERLDAVMLIAGQLAVSLANAQLYESLEERVAARTRELEQTQAQLVATARRAGRAEIANNVLHNVGNVLNSINVSASIVSRTIGNSRIEGLARAVGLMNEHQGDLARFMGQDPRGKTLLGYLNELVGTLKAERQEALSDLERLARSVEHITYVVATQQSHAGPSSVLEATKPSDVLEDALRMSGEILERHGVSVLRRYGAVPEMALDKQRLLQILVNLIGNAAQAMEDVASEDRQLTLGMEMVAGESGERLRIAVQDRGEGIPPENLTRIFAHGFTTKSGGHGFGLHSSALAAMEIGAKLTAHSDGPGRGAVFTLEVPLQAAAPTSGSRA